LIFRCPRYFGPLMLLLLKFFIYLGD